MDPIAIGIISFAVLILIFLLGMPTALTMGLVGIAGFAYLVSPAAAGSLLAKDLFYTFSDYQFTAIPLFVWMGFLALYGGLGDKLFSTAYKLVGHIRGGLAMATVLACTAFGAICGSSTATTATFSVVAWPEMQKQKYNPSLGTACIAASGILGVMIPPSVVLIVYAFISEQPIPQLFIASIVPGLLLALLYMIVIYITCLIDPSLGPAGPKVSFKEKLSSLTSSGTWELLAIFILVIGGLFGGLFSPSESGAAGAAAVLIVVLVRKKISLKGFTSSLADSTWTVAMILLIVSGAKMFGHFIAVTGLPHILAGYAATFPFGSTGLWILNLFAWLILGCFIDPLALTLLMVPIFLPMLVKAGFNPIWMGPMTVLAGGMGVLTPPVGMDVFVVSGMTKVPLATVFKGIVPFLLAIIVCIAICTAFPQIVLFLPGLMK